MSIPYFSAQSEKTLRWIISSVAKYFFDFIIRMCFSPLCDRLSFALSVRSFVFFFTRESQSIAVWAISRTGAHLTDPPHSLIHNHAKACSSSPIKIKDLKILGNCNNVLDLHFLESLYINKMKPVLKCDKTAFPLFIVNT